MGPAQLLLGLKGAGPGIQVRDELTSQEPPLVSHILILKSSRDLPGGHWVEMFGTLRLRPQLLCTVVQMAPCTKVLWERSKWRWKSNLVPLTKPTARGDLSAQGWGTTHFFSQNIHCKPCCSSVSSYYVTLGKVISLLGLGFPFEKLSSIKQRFNLDGELESPGTFKKY